MRVTYNNLIMPLGGFQRRKTRKKKLNILTTLQERYIWMVKLFKRGDETSTGLKSSNNFNSETQRHWRDFKFRK
jgi:hypothetical protein